MAWGPISEGEFVMTEAAAPSSTATKEHLTKHLKDAGVVDLRSTRRSAPVRIRNSSGRTLLSVGFVHKFSDEKTISKTWEGALRSGAATDHNVRVTYRTGFLTPHDWWVVTAIDEAGNVYISDPKNGQCWISAIERAFKGAVPALLDFFNDLQENLTTNKAKAVAAAGQVTVLLLDLVVTGTDTCGFKQCDLLEEDENKIVTLEINGLPPSPSQQAENKLRIVPAESSSCTTDIKMAQKAPPPITNVWPNGHAYFFKGSDYLRYNLGADRVDAGYPMKIDGGWPGFPPEFDAGVQAYLMWAGGKVYFFKGSKYVRFDIVGNKVDGGYPQSISNYWSGFPASFASGIDAAVRWNNGKAYFFKGSHYLRYDIAADKVDPGYPFPIAGHWKGFPASFESGIDAAVMWNNGKAYFFKGSHYLRFDVAADKVDPGFPASISANWTGLPEKLDA
jgi:hypothetical protein